MEEGIVQDGIVTQDSTQVQTVWALREQLAEALKREGFVYKYDVSLPLPHLYELVEQMRERVADKAISCVGYGHLGDGRLARVLS